MNFLQLSYFRALAKSENLSLTASELFISPPALSSSISRLEKELGVSLFEKRGNRIFLNENGQIFLEHVEAIFYELDCATEEIKTNNQRGIDELHLATTSHNAWLFLLSSFISDHPDIIVSNTVLQVNQIAPIDLLKKFDYLITALGDISDVNVKAEILYDDDFPVLMVYPEHRFARRNDIDLREAKDELFITLNAGYSSRIYFDALCTAANFTPKIKMECSYIMRTRMVEQRLGIAVTTMRASKQIDCRKIRLIPVTSPYIPRVQALFSHTKRKETLVAKIFRDYAIEYFRNS